MSVRHQTLLVCLAALLSAAFSFWAAKREDPKERYPITRVAVSRSGQWWAVASETGWIGIFDHEHPDTPQRFRMLLSGKVRDLRFTPDEEWLVIQAADLSRHPVKILGTTELITHEQDTSEPQRSGSVPAGVDKSEVTSNIVPGPGTGTVLYGNYAGSVEVRDQSGKLLEQYTFR